MSPRVDIVGRDKVAEIGVNVTPLEKDSKLLDAVLSVHHATMHMFSGTPAVKIIENHHDSSDNVAACSSTSSGYPHCTQQG